MENEKEIQNESGLEEELLNVEEQEEQEEIEVEDTEEEAEVQEQEEEPKPKKQEKLEKALASLEKDLGMVKRFLKDTAKEKAQGKERKPIELSYSDIKLALDKGLEEEDVEQVKRYAEFANISFKEALNDDIVQASLKKMKEARLAKEAMHSGTRRKSEGVSERELLQKFKEKGEVPEPGTEEADKFFEARLRGQF